MTNLRPSLANGYTLILPPGWIRLDARSEHGTEELDRELDRILSTVPRDSYGPLVGLFDAIMLTWRWHPGLVI